LKYSRVARGKGWSGRSNLQTIGKRLFMPSLKEWDELRGGGFFGPLRAGEKKKKVDRTLRAKRIIQAQEVIRKRQGMRGKKIKHSGGSK